MMRAAVVTEDRALEVRSVPRPEPGPGEVRIEVAACGICGSDLHMLPSPALPAGSVMGHEFAGVVDAVGPGVVRVSEGARVVVFPVRPTPEHDLEAVLTTSVGGPSAPGAYAQWAIVREEMLWTLPDGLELEHAALVEPLAVALHAVDLAELPPDQPVAVIGAGPIGILVALALRASGVESLVVVERDEARRERIAALGFEALGLDDVHATVPAALGAAPPRVFECAGHPSAPNLAIELVAVSGRVMLMGFLEEQVPISQLSLMLKEAQLHSTWAYRPHNYDEAIELLRSRVVDADQLITAREPLERVNELFAELRTPGTTHVKVLLVPGMAA